uniref:Putative secreted protein n=1 Tax=Ixodes ricinus TaxID=34613 RepID=A0A6B0U6I5_IXORI
MLVVVFFVWVETTFGGNREATTWPCIRYPVRLPNLTAFWRQIIPHSLKERVIGLPPWVKHVRCQEMQLVLYKEKKNGNVTFAEDCAQLCTRLRPCAVGWL